ncbi:hypothetical protein GmHk_18G051632 [Glycine max]|nr:hypothetical protein GmHk_18G051632 [Glycine max]
MRRLLVWSYFEHKMTQKLSSISNQFENQLVDLALSSTISHDTATPSTKTKSGKPFKTRVQPPLSSLSAPCSLAAGDQLGYCFHPHFCFDQFASDNALWTPSCANGIGFWSPLTSSSGDSAKRSWKSSWLGRWSTVDRF